MGNMKANGENAKRLMVAVLDELAKPEHVDLVDGRHLQGASKMGFSTHPHGMKAQAKEKISFLFPDYFN